MSQTPKTMPQKKRRTPRSARKITLGVVGGISARNRCPAAAPIVSPQDRNVFLIRPPVPVICRSSCLVIRLETDRLCRELIAALATRQPVSHAREPDVQLSGRPARRRRGSQRTRIPETGLTAIRPNGLALESDVML